MYVRNEKEDHPRHTHTYVNNFNIRSQIVLQTCGFDGAYVLSIKHLMSGFHKLPYY